MSKAQTDVLEVCPTLFYGRGFQTVFHGTPEFHHTSLEFRKPKQNFEKNIMKHKTL